MLIHRYYCRAYLRSPFAVNIIYLLKKTTLTSRNYRGETCSQYLAFTQSTVFGSIFAFHKNEY